MIGREITKALKGRFLWSSLLPEPMYVVKVDVQGPETYELTLVGKRSWNSHKITISNANPESFAVGKENA